MAEKPLPQIYWFKDRGSIRFSIITELDGAHLLNQLRL